MRQVSITNPALGALISATLLAAQAAAQGTTQPAASPEDAVAIEEIVVTAQKRAESLQKVPVSITALSADELAARQIRAPEDLVMGVPNLQSNAAIGDGVPIFSLRGISMSDFSFAQNGPIATYYDEVYKGNFALLGLNLFDLERVEVLKGPQGTLYGKNTTGGAINLISRKPDFTTGGNLSLGYGNFDHFMADGAAQTALSEVLAARVAFTFERGDGWMKNVSPGKSDLNAVRQYGVRGTLLYRPSDTVDVTLRLATSLQNPVNYGTPPIPGPDGVGGTVYPFFGIPADFRTGLGRREVDTPEVFRRRARTYAVSATANIRVGDDLTVTSISSWDKGTLYNHEDADGTPLALTEAVYYGRTRQFAQDLRLTSDFDGPFDFIVGGYFHRERVFNFTDINYFRDLDVNGDGPIDAQDCIDGGGFLACQVGNRLDQSKDSYALYSDASYQLTEVLKLRGGLRYTHDKGRLRNFQAQARDFNGVPLINFIPGSATDLDATTSQRFSNDNVSGKIGLDYQVSGNVMAYASYSRGYRGAAFNGQAFFSPAELTIARPEKIQAVEIGLKSDLFDRRVRINGAAFWYGYRNQQFLDTDPVTTIPALINLPKSRIFGGELELQVRPVPSLTLSGALGLLDTKVKEGTAQGMDVAGKRLIQAPSVSLTSSVDWALPLGDLGSLDTRVDLAYASKQYFDIINRPSTTEDGYTLINGRIRFHPEDDRYGISVWVKNLTNAFYYTNMIDASGIGFIYTHQNARRTYGVTFDMTF